MPTLTIVCILGIHVWGIWIYRKNHKRRRCQQCGRWEIKNV